MKIFLNSPQTENELADSYESAMRSAKELYIASAYLTNWSTKIALNSRCEKLLFLVGTDFGLTRKKACSAVIKWLPKHFYNDFYAVPVMNAGNFHPKIVAWSDLKNKFHCIIGSSNLTEAAFNSNYEANVEIIISEKEFINFKTWLEGIVSTKFCEPINDDWIKKYKERILKGGGRNKIKHVFNLLIPDGKKYREGILRRRKNERSFAEIKGRLKSIMILCAKGGISNKEFWNRFWNLWSNHSSRIQGSGIQFTGKTANWKAACTSFLRILDSSSSVSELGLDHIVKDEIDKLKGLENPVRGAWFSEMLCHFFPDKYPIVANPVKIFLRENKWKPQRGLSEGGKYIDLAKKLREKINQNNDGPENMPEIDSVMWRWCDERGLLDKLKYGN